jgi:hypothetical protein
LTKEGAATSPWWVDHEPRRNAWLTCDGARRSLSAGVGKKEEEDAGAATHAAGGGRVAILSARKGIVVEEEEERGRRRGEEEKLGFAGR